MRWSVGSKIGTAFLLAMTVVIIVGGISYKNTRDLIRGIALRRQSYEILLQIERFSSSLKDAETGQRGYLISGEENYLQPYLEAVTQIGSQLRTLDGMTVDDSQQNARAQALEKVVEEKLIELKETIALRRSAGAAAAVDAVRTDRGKAAMDKARSILSAMGKAEEAKLRQRLKEAGASAHSTFAAIGYGIVISTVLLFLAGYILRRNIAEPLAELTAVADKISKGEVDIALPAVLRTDEVGALRGAFHRMTASLNGVAARARQLAAGDLRGRIEPHSQGDVLGNAFSEMVASLRAVIEEILEAVNVLGTTASQIMASTSEWAASAAQTATAVSETATTVEEVKHTAHASSERGRAVAQSAQRAAEVSQTGRASVEATVEGMRRVRTQMNLIAGSIVHLSEQSQTISEIIAVVDDLAAQSHLLAVNASIEAARAGEQGRGFAVVAQEVKNLAEQSRRATTQVRGILTEIQRATGAAVLATEQGRRAVETGEAQSRAAGEAIRVLTESMDGAAQEATQIAATSRQQFVGMDQVALAMANIKNATVQTVASTRQAEAAAQSLQDLGQKLKALIERFKL